MKLVGIDIGTTSICAVVIDTERGTLLYSITEPNSSRVKAEEPYAYLQDPGLIWCTVQRIMNDILGQHRDVGAVGVSGQMHGILYVDPRGNPVSPLYTWQDGRGNLLHSDGQTYGEVLQHRTGYPVVSGFGMVTHFYHVCTNTVPHGAVSLCTIGDFVAMKLADQIRPVMDPTNAASLGIFRNGRFDAEALADAGIATDMMPPVASSATQVGKTAFGVPVFAALGDNQASFLGAVPSLHDTVLVNIGTGAQVSVWSDQPVTTPGWEQRPFPGDGWLYVGASLGGGKSYALLERFFRNVCRMFTGLEVGSLYRQMNDLTEGLPEPRDPLVIHPQFFGSRNDPTLRGRISNVSEANFTPEELIRAWIDGMATELNTFFRNLPDEMDRNIIRLVGSGNGIRRNRALRNAIQRQFKLPLVVSPCEEEAAAGAALCAGVGAQVFSDFHAAGETLWNH